MKKLVFVNRECVLDVRKIYTGRLCPENLRLKIVCSVSNDDESYKDVQLSLTPDQQDKLKAWLASKEHELTLIDDDCTLSLLRRATGLDVKCLDSQTWLAKPTDIEIEMTLNLEQVEKLTKWLAQTFGVPGF